VQDEINVIIHGFTGNKEDVEYLREYLDTRGLATHCVALAGHGGTKQELSKSSHKDWISSAQAEVAELTKTYTKVNLIGFSMGGLIGINLCTKFDTGKVVLVNTPIYFLNVQATARRIISDILSGGRENIDFYRKNAAKVSPKSSIDFIKIVLQSIKVLERADHKCIILQCINDEIIHYKSANYLKNKLGENALLRYYEGGQHKIFMVEESLRDDMCEDIYLFLTGDTQKQSS